MINQTTDYKMISDMLLNDKELFERISDDYTNVELFDPSKFHWLGWFENDVCKGLLQVNNENAVTVGIHLNIPKKFRGKDSFKIGNGLIDFLIENCNKQIRKINAKIPTCFPDVIRFGEKCGFETEGIDRQSYIKNGKIFDRVMIGKIIR